MKTHLRFLAMLFLLLSAAAPTVAQQPSSSSHPPAAQRAQELVALINAADYEAAAAYIRKNYAADFLNAAPMQRHLSFLFGGHPRGVELHNVQRPDTTKAIALLENSLTGTRLNLHVSVTDQPA